MSEDDDEATTPATDEPQGDDQGKLQGLTHYAVGKLYTPTRTSWPEGVDYNYRQGQHELRIFFNRPRPAEVQAVEIGTPRFGLLVDGPCIVLLYRFGGEPWSDGSYSWHLVQPDERTLPEVPSTDSHERAGLLTFLTDASNGILRAIRYCSFSPEFTRALHGAIRDQAARVWDEGEYTAHLDRLYALSTERMVAQAKVFCTGGD